MLPPPVTRIRLPPAPQPPARTGFPWAAILAPVLVSVGLWAVTGSVFGLLFAVLGPVVAIAGLLDGARSRRRSGRRAHTAFVTACERVLHEIADAHERESARLATACAGPGDPVWAAAAESVPVRAGTGSRVSSVELSGDDPEHAAPAVAEWFARLRRAAGEPPPGPVLHDAASGVGVVGPPLLAAAVARAVAVQLAAILSPSSTELSAPAGEEWTASLPHTRRADAECYRWHPGGSARDIVVAWAGSPDRLPLGCGTVVHLEELGVPYALSCRAAADTARELAERAVTLGARPARAMLPRRVELAALLDPIPSAGTGLAAPIGGDDGGPVIVDLVTQGPHALIAGTTGSGKSELLVSWVLAMAHGRAPAAVAFLLIDFKGGAAFAPLAGLPHVVGTLSDLDARLTRRAVESLRAELLRRERLLAGAGVRAIEDLPAGALARLVIVVDEFAALVASGPELQDVFSDLAARGRSLGLHLVLCTQRPAGVVRDAVLANIGLRVSLRVTDRSESIAMLGDDAAARLPAEPRGRAILLHDGVTRELQVALATRQDTQRITDQTAGSAGAGAPWCDPLPSRLELDALPATPEGPVFGLLDLPAEQRQPLAVYDRASHGSLLVTGAAGSGVTTALVTLAESARRGGCPGVVLPGDPADAWQVLAGPPDSGLLIADDLDMLLDRFDAGHRHEFAEHLSVLLRAGAVRVLAGVRRLDGEAGRLARAFDSRLVLRQASREDHLLAGGESAGFDPTLPPGRGTWRGADVQIAIVRDGALPGPHPTPVPRVSCAEHPRIAVISARPHADTDLLHVAGWRVVPLGPGAGTEAHQIRYAGGPVALLGDPDAWNSDWALLSSARRDLPIVMRGCTAADHRALLNGRDLPPPLGADPAECWLAAENGTVRARIEAVEPPNAPESVVQEPPGH